MKKVNLRLAKAFIVIPLLSLLLFFERIICERDDGLNITDYISHQTYREIAFLISLPLSLSQPLVPTTMPGNFYVTFYVTFSEFCHQLTVTF